MQLVTHLSANRAQRLSLNLVDVTKDTTATPSQYLNW